MTGTTGKLLLGSSYFGMDWHESCRSIELTGGGTKTQKIHPAYAMRYFVKVATGTTGKLILPDLSSMVQQIGLVHEIVNVGGSGTHAGVALEDVWGTSYGTIAIGNYARVFSIANTTKGVNPGGATFVVNTRAAQPRTTFG